MISVYVIRSKNKNFRYVGITNNINERLERHNTGKNKSTRNYAPFVLTYSEKYKDYKEARMREKFLKSGVGRKFLDSLQ
ncbi:MAG: GIY-YIG nuclease family protein [bacterium]|nr:GIY-YIG nuclease family protein [bacterium]